MIRTVAAGGTLLPAAETSRRLQALAASRRREWQAQILAEQLTPRERQVLQYLAQGADKLQIQELHISPDTVKTHIRGLLAKLNVSSRLEAVVEALRLKLVDPPQR